jgi:polyisoprenoid-binding protein YceI
MPSSSRLVALAVAALAITSHAAQAQRPGGPARPAARPAVTLVPAPTGNEARYRVREQLANLDFPNDAIGKTSRVDGRLMIGPDGRLVRDSSRFVVDLASLTSDAARRDNFVRRRSLQTDSFPTATFVPRTATGLPAAALARTPGAYTFTLLGDLTVRGVTRPSTWQVTARLAPSGEVTGTATTSFTFAEFGMTVPKVAVVLSVDDLIKLEYDFALVPLAPAARAGQ